MSATNSTVRTWVIPTLVSFIVCVLVAYSLTMLGAKRLLPKPEPAAVQAQAANPGKPKRPLAWLKWRRDQHKAQLFSARERLVLYLNYYQDLQTQMSDLSDPRREELQDRMRLVDWHERVIRDLEQEIIDQGGEELIHPSKPAPAGHPINSIQKGLND